MERGKCLQVSERYGQIYFHVKANNVAFSKAIQLLWRSGGTVQRAHVPCNQSTVAHPSLLIGIWLLHARVV